MNTLNKSIFIRKLLNIGIHSFFLFSFAFLCAEDRIADALTNAEKLPLVNRLDSDARSGSLSGIKNKVFQKAVEFSGNSFKENKFTENKEFVYSIIANEFFQKISPAEIKIIGLKSPQKMSAFLVWLCKNPEVMLEFNELGPIPGDHNSFFSDWNEIYQLRPDSRIGLGKKVALALAHANACGQVHNHLVRNASVTALSRYYWFMKSVQGGAFMRDVSKMSHFDLRFVLGALFTNEDLEWCQKRYREPSFSWKSPDKVFMGYRIVPYRKKSKTGFPIENSKGFYDNNPQSIPIYAEYGGVCMAVSRTGNAFCHAAGVPTFLITQPTHMAFAWKSTSGHWNIGNDIQGWNFSYEHKHSLPWHGPPAMIFLYDKFHSDLGQSRESLFFTWMAHVNKHSGARRIEFYKMALEKAPLNFEALQSLLHEGISTRIGRDDIRNFLLEKALPNLIAYPYAIEHLSNTSNATDFFTRMKTKTSTVEMKEKFYNLFSRMPSTTLSGSALVVSTNFFLQHNGTFKLDLGGEPQRSHEKIKAQLSSDAKMDEKKIMEELEIPLKAAIGNAQISGRFFEYYLELAKRKPLLKISALIFLDTLNKKTTKFAEKQIIKNWTEQIKKIEIKNESAKKEKPRTDKPHLRKKSK